ncbi:hypothetical protein TVAG_199530 [Trichomonas vaginalis G3]|uniref:Uncharacterized protein n=1 Tax=Trichomonas vaginalis (strain ATCC PRA-98 / G3) TaxID=412133 RepID=A2DDY8_TRIV3|nr:hypothetical protein TVAGG3_1000140 [Trichomonas vaginalis G3]EAY21514.1 hypothetical protein TVAG_199530 [Trichomonas vaginalis G3]KAI5490730.1 hypothetical protein TVAGG3_1000140 [Trichomonas vaginalis G3]|eukprot:XP_001582500.1 hypothetical protein [Trichomonas vaginalis G3]
MQSAIAQQIPDIIQLVVASLNDCNKSADFPQLFTEDAKLTFETTKKESRDHVVALFQEKQKTLDAKGPFSVTKYSFVIVSETEIIINGLAQWGGVNNLLTICFQISKDQKLQISNFMLTKLA